MTKYIFLALLPLTLSCASVERCNRQAAVYVDDCVESVKDYCEGWSSTECANAERVCISNHDFMVSQCNKR